MDAGLGRGGADRVHDVRDAAGQFGKVRSMASRFTVGQVVPPLAWQE